jgi:hypothetical protein
MACQGVKSRNIAVDYQLITIGGKFKAKKKIGIVAQGRSPDAQRESKGRAVGASRLTVGLGIIG